MVDSPIGRAGPAAHPALIGRGLRLSYLTLGYNSLEGVVALVAGFMAGSIALVGFGADSLIEVTASGAAIWRLHAERDPGRRERAERVTGRIVGVCFLALAAYVAGEAVHALDAHEVPRVSVTGIVLAALSIIVMPLLARAKRRVAVALGSGALEAESRQTSLCAWLSAILLGGLVLNALAGWWWADPMAALGMVPIIAHEGLEGLRGESSCGDDCH